MPPAASRPIRSGEDPGSIEYSAVTQPFPDPFIHRGTSSSTEAVQSTRVRPKVTSTEPAAISVKSRSKVIGRSSPGARPSGRGMVQSFESGTGSSQLHLDGGGQLGAEEPAAEVLEPADVAGGVEAVLRRPRRRAGRAAQVRARPSTRRTSKAVSSAELTSTTSRPMTSPITRARYG